MARLTLRYLRYALSALAAVAFGTSFNSRGPRPRGPGRARGARHRPADPAAEQKG